MVKEEFLEVHATIDADVLDSVEPYLVLVSEDPI